MADEIEHLSGPPDAAQPGAAPPDAAPPDPNLPIGPEGPTDAQVEHAKQAMWEGHFQREDAAQAKREDAPPDPKPKAPAQEADDNAPDPYQRAWTPLEEKRDANRQAFEDRRAAGPGRLREKQSLHHPDPAVRMEAPPDPGGGRAPAAQGQNAGGGGIMEQLAAQMGRIEGQNMEILHLLRGGAKF